jgi:hypothetical protein
VTRIMALAQRIYTERTSAWNELVCNVCLIICHLVLQDATQESGCSYELAFGHYT